MIIEIDSRRYEDQDDCLAAAAAGYVADHPDADGWDLSPRWADSERETILLDVPPEAGMRVISGAADGREGTVLHVINGSTVQVEWDADEDAPAEVQHVHPGSLRVGGAS